MQVDGLPVALIDWDAAKPGPRALDLAHAVWYWAVISKTDVLPLDEQVRRVRLMCEAYGGAVERSSVPDAILAAQDRVVSHIANTPRSDEAYSRYWHRALKWHRGELAWFAAHRDEFERGLQ